MKFKDLPKPVHRYITSGIRMAFARSEYYYEYMKDGRYEWHDGSRDRVSYSCEECKKNYLRNNIRLDHIVPVIPLDSCLDEMIIQEYINNVFFTPVQRLCKSCHKLKTNEENSQRRAFKKARKCE